MSGSLTKTIKTYPDGGGVSYAFTAGGGKVLKFNIQCGPEAGTLSLESLAFMFKGKLSTAGTGNTQFAGIRLGSNAVVRSLELKFNGKQVVNIPTWAHYCNHTIMLTADYGTYSAGTSGKMAEYYCASTISSSAERWFKANIAINGLSATKHVIDLSELSSFEIILTLEGYNNAFYNTTGDPRFTISDMYVSYLAGRKPTTSCHNVLTFIKVSSTDVTSDTTMTIPLPDESDICKRVLVAIAQTETNMTTNLKFISDASTITEFSIVLPGKVWPEGVISSTYVNPDLYRYASECYNQSNLNYFTSDGIPYANFYTASTYGFLGFNLAGCSDHIGSSESAEYSRYGEATKATSKVVIKQSAVTVTGLCRLFQESVAQCSLDGKIEVKTTGI